MATKLQTPTPSKGVQFQLNANTFLRTGYTFNGWSTNYASSISEFADNAYVTFDGDRDLYALWKANNYQVRFNANGGTGSMGNQTFTYDQGQYLVANAFGRTGHDFNRWTANADGSGNQYGNGVWVSNLTATPGGIVDLYAQWNIKQYTETFVHNDGTGAITQKTQDYGSALTAPTLTRTGYRLSSWSPEVPATVPAMNVEYVAQWELLTCVVNFDVCSDEATPVDSKTLNRGAALGELPTTSWPKPQGMAGMQFAGWWTEETGGVQVTPNTQVPMDKTQVTYYAHWEGVIHYQRVSKNTDQFVEIDSNGVASNFYGNSTESKYRALLSVADDRFDFSGNFTIVMKAKAASAVSYFRQDVFAGLDDGSSYNIFMDFGLYGRQTQWEIARYEPNHDLVVADTPLIQPDEVFTLKVVRTLEGNVSTVKCYVNNDSSPVLVGNQGNFAIGRFAIGIDRDAISEYFRGSIYLNECYLVQENANSAQPRGKYKLRLLETAQYVVTLDEQGGHGGDTSVLVTYAQDMPQIEIPTRTGYIFGGYYDGTNGSGTQYYNADGTGVSGKTWDKTSNATLYAKWVDDWVYLTFTSNDTHVMVTFDANGGVGGTRNVCECGSEIIVPTVTRQGYLFAGWEPTVDNIVPNHDVTYVAQWTENKYTVTFNPGTGSVSPTTKQVTYGSAYGELPTPSTTV